MGMFRALPYIALAALLPACTPAPQVVSPSTSPSTTPSTAATGSAAASASPGAAASASPGTSASATPAASGIAAASASPAAPSAGTGILKGQVYSSNVNFVPDGTTVTVASLDPAQPFTASVTTQSGAYVVNNIPINVQLQVTANRPGWTSRTRVLVLRAYDPLVPDRNTYNFGGPSTTVDPAGPGFYLSDYPEIEKVEPVDQDTSAPNDQMKFQITVSEPLDATNQRRLASAFLLVPNNQEALGPNDVLPASPASGAALTGLRIGTNPLTVPAYRYRENSGYLNGFAVSQFQWGSDNRTATFTLQAPVKTGKDKEGEYAFMLVSQDDNPIVDASNNALGMDSSQHWGTYTKGGIIYDAVKRPGLVLTSSVTGKDEDRWAETHQTWTRFSVAKDNVAPKLLSVVARRNYVDDVTPASDRVEFTFSKPMVAFPNVRSASLLSLNNYVVAAAPTDTELAQRDVASLKSTVVAPGQAFDVARDAINSPHGMVVDSDAASAGNYSIKLSVKDPHVVILSMPAGALPLDANFVKAYAGNDSNAATGANKTVGDPAGNDIDSTADTAVGPIF